MSNGSHRVGGFLQIRPPVVVAYFFSFSSSTIIDTNKKGSSISGSSLKVTIVAAAMEDRAIFHGTSDSRVVPHDFLDSLGDILLLLLLLL